MIVSCNSDIEMLNMMYNRICATSLHIFFILYLNTNLATQAADVTYLRSTITDYFSETRYHEAPFFVNKHRAKDFIYKEFQRFGLQTEYHSFQATTSKSSGTFTFYNVVGVLKGSRLGTGDDRIIGVGSHYDTVATTPGVDDNGSGMAALLETAKQVTNSCKNGVKPLNTIIFVAFDMEEIGIHGSKRFIQEWITQWLVSNYGNKVQQLRPHGVVVLETIMEYNTSDHSQRIPGDAELFQTAFREASQSISSDNYRGDFLATVYRQAETDGDSALANAFRNQWNLQQKPRYQLKMFGLPDYWKDHKKDFVSFLLSDHSNFWDVDVPSIMLTDSAFLRGDMISCYHKMCDNAEVMLTDDNLEFLAKTCDTLAATVESLALVSAASKPCVIPTLVGLLISARLFLAL